MTSDTDGALVRNCPTCGWLTDAPDYELGTDRGINASSKCRECGHHRPAMMRVTFLDSSLTPVDALSEAERQRDAALAVVEAQKEQLIARVTAEGMADGEKFGEASRNAEVAYQEWLDRAALPAFDASQEEAPRG